MKRRLPVFGLPLLARELSEQAAHGRHYVLRSACATLVFALGFLFLYQLLGSEGGGVASLGHGSELFDRVYGVQLAGVLLFLPAITCGAIAGEKERNTLSVLLTTRLGATTIILEKLLARLVPAFVLLLLSVPLLTVGYAMGGLTLDSMIGQISFLTALTVFITTLSLACSAWCGSTVSAFFMTYGIALVLAMLASRSLAWLADVGAAPIYRRWIVFQLVGSLVLFGLASFSLRRRAFVNPRNFLLSAFRALDTLYVRLNRSFGNVVLTRETNLLPDDKPIAWRETAKKSLGTVRYLVRVLVVLEFPTLFLMVSSAQMGGLRASSGISTGLWYVLWCVAAALIAVTCGSLLASERTRQTLPVLLATPIPGREIIHQLFAGVRRLIFVLWIPFVTIAVFDYWYYLNMAIPNETTVHERLLCKVLQLAIYPYLIAWITFLIGSKIRSPMWAIIASLSIVAGIVIVPILSQWLFGLFLIRGDWPLLLTLASPGMIVALNEQRHATLAITTINFVAYGLLLYVFRRVCLHRADRLLGRAEMSATPRVPQMSPAVDETLATV